MNLPRKPLFTFLLLSLLFLSKLMAQTPLEDSLNRVLSKAILADTSRIRMYNLLSEMAINNRQENALTYAQKAFALAQKDKQILGMARALTHMGTHYLYANALDTAFTLFNNALELLQNEPHKNLEAELQKKKGVIYYYAGNTDSALYYFKNSLILNEQIGDSLEIIKAYNNIGAISLRTRKLDQAISYFFKCLAFDEKVGDQKAIASDCNNIGITLIEKKDYTAARKYLQRAIEIRWKLDDKLGIVRATFNIGTILDAEKKYQEVVDVLTGVLRFLNQNEFPDEASQINNNLGVGYKNLGQYQIALKYLFKSLDIKRTHNLDKDLASNLGNIGNVYLQLKNYSLAIKYSLESEQIAKENKLLEIERNAVIILTESYLRNKQNDKAIEYLRKSVDLNESYYNEQNATALAEIQTKFETEKKESENKLLLQENEIKQLELVSHQDKIKNQRYAIGALIVSILLIVLVVLWRINVGNLKKKELELLNAQKAQQEKERISRDLHDHVGGQLSFVLYSLDGLLDQNENKRREISQSINESVRQVIGNLRETIWAINDEHIPIQDFSDKLKVYARSMFRHSNIEIDFQENLEQVITMNSTTGLNLFRICQEILNNAFKHSQAQKIQIQVKASTEIEVQIADNGIGFNANTDAAGYGLANIKKRAAETGIKVSVQTEPKHGVSYKLIV